MQRVEAYVRRALLLALLFSGLPAAHAADWQLADLMQQLGQVKNAQARFVERKYIALLDKPVESSGELSFTAPDRMEMRTLRPKKQSLLLEGNRLIRFRGQYADWCSPAVWVDGQYQGELAADELDGWIDPKRVVGLELYAGSVVPQEFSRGMVGTECGSLVIWTR